MACSLSEEELRRTWDSLAMQQGWGKRTGNYENTITFRQRNLDRMSSTELPSADCGAQLAGFIHEWSELTVEQALGDMLGHVRP